MSSRKLIGNAMRLIERTVSLPPSLFHLPPSLTPSKSQGTQLGLDLLLPSPPSSLPWPPPWSTRRMPPSPPPNPPRAACRTPPPSPRQPPASPCSPRSSPPRSERQFLHQPGMERLRKAGKKKKSPTSITCFISDSVSVAKRHFISFMGRSRTTRGTTWLIQFPPPHHLPSPGPCLELLDLRVRGGLFETLGDEHEERLERLASGGGFAFLRHRKHGHTGWDRLGSLWFGLVWLC